MSNLAKAICVLSLAAVVLVAGCEPEPQQQTSEQQGRLYATQNTELTKELEQNKRQYENKLTEMQKQLDKCNNQKQQLEKGQNAEAIKAFEESALVQILGEMTKLQTENTELKAVIAEMKAPLKQAQQ